MIPIQRLIEGFDGRCYFCGTPVSLNERAGRYYATRDHLMPKSRSGSNGANNVVLACMACNAMKGNMSENEFMRLVRKAEQDRLDAAWRAAHPEQNWT